MLFFTRDSRAELVFCVNVEHTVQTCHKYVDIGFEYLPFSPITFVAQAIDRTYQMEPGPGHYKMTIVNPQEQHAPKVRRHVRRRQEEMHAKKWRGRIERTEQVRL